MDKPITADDFIFGTLLYLAKDMPVPGLDPYDSVARIEKLDNYTIRVYFTAVDKTTPTTFMPSTAYHCTRNTGSKECFEDHGNLPKDC